MSTLPTETSAEGYPALCVITCDDGSVDLARSELVRAAPQARVLAELAPGILLVDAGAPFARLASTWQAQPPIFVRHLAPASTVAPLYGDPGDVTVLAAALGERNETASLMAAVDASASFSVQARVLGGLPYKPFELNNLLADMVATATGAVLDVRKPQQILSVVCGLVAPRLAAELTGERRRSMPGDTPIGLLGLSRAVQNLSDWAGGMRRFAREEGQISRSEFKLLEALETFAVDLPAHGVALDLGAAPGGWTRVLRQRGQYVTAVDPAELDPRLGADRHVRHKRMTAEEYLQSDPDQFDVIVNDMRMDARDSARLMVGYAPHLYSHGVAIMTLKLPEEERAPIIERALATLSQAYKVAGARQLFHNRSEITVVLRPRR